MKVQAMRLADRWLGLPACFFLSLWQRLFPTSPHTLRAPTGRYDLLGNPVLSEGDVLIDSVLRFKGRAAPCVILTEVDFEQLDERAMRRLFVGATRATLKLLLVVSARSAGVLPTGLREADGA